MDGRGAHGPNGTGGTGTGGTGTGGTGGTGDTNAEASATADAKSAAGADSGASADARRLVAALATPERLRVLAAVVLGAGRPSEIAARSGIAEARVLTALSRLQKAGLVRVDAHGFVADSRPFADVARRAAPERPATDYGASDPVEAAVLNAFLIDGRLASMPAQRSKRRIVLEHIVVVFEPGRRYTEPEVNVVLASFYSDTATLRRYLVDEQLLDRADGHYWRIGGWVDVLE